MPQLRNNGETSQTFGELMGFYRYTAEDFPEGACFLIDEARTREAASHEEVPRLLTEGAKTFRQLLLEQSAVTAPVSIEPAIVLSEVA